MSDAVVLRQALQPLIDTPRVSMFLEGSCAVAQWSSLRRWCKPKREWFMPPRASAVTPLPLEARLSHRVIGTSTSMEYTETTNNHLNCFHFVPFNFPRKCLPQHAVWLAHTKFVVSLTNKRGNADKMSSSPLPSLALFQIVPPSKTC